MIYRTPTQSFENFGTTHAAQQIEFDFRIQSQFILQYKIEQKFLSLIWIGLDLPTYSIVRRWKAFLTKGGDYFLATTMNQ